MGIDDTAGRPWELRANTIEYKRRTNEGETVIRRHARAFNPRSDVSCFQFPTNILAYRGLTDHNKLSNMIYLSGDEDDLAANNIPPARHSATAANSPSGGQDSGPSTIALEGEGPAKAPAGDDLPPTGRAVTTAISVMAPPGDDLTISGAIDSDVGAPSTVMQPVVGDRDATSDVVRPSSLATSDGTIFIITDSPDDGDAPCINQTMGVKDSPSVVGSPGPVGNDNLTTTETGDLGVGPSITGSETVVGDGKPTPISASPSPASSDVEVDVLDDSVDPPTSAAVLAPPQLAAPVAVVDSHDNRTCPQCQRAFDRPANMRRHLTVGVLNLMIIATPHKRCFLQLFAKNGSCHKKSDGVKNCPHCYIVFAREENLQRHLLARERRGGTCENVKSGRTSTKELTCAICAEKCSTQALYIQHAVAMHGIEGAIAKKTFSSTVHYDEWFASATKEQQFHWSRAPGSSSKDKTTHFLCSRSGTYKQKGDEKRNRAKKGTSKMDADCTCFMTMRKESTSEIVVEYCLDHVGHGVDVCFLPKDKIMKVRQILSRHQHSPTTLLN